MNGLNILPGYERLPGFSYKKSKFNSKSLAHNCPCPVPEKFIACHHLMEIAARLAKENLKTRFRSLQTKNPTRLLTDGIFNFTDKNLSHCFIYERCCFA